MEDKQLDNISIIIPAYNEELTIKEVVKGFHDEIPDAEIWVVDNNSTDNTGAIAEETIDALECRGGVLFEAEQGKSNAIRRAFNEIEANIYVMVDADLTYSPKDLQKLVAPALCGEADLIIGDRMSSGSYSEQNERRFHQAGNSFVAKLVNILFNSNLNDIMSGYRVMNRKFVKLYPILRSGFEIETEMTIHALDKRFRISEVKISYGRRPEESESKLNTFQDGYKIIKLIFTLFKDYRPMPFFLLLSSLFLISSIGVGLPVIHEFISTGLINRIPSAILATGLSILSVIFLSLALIMDTIVNLHRADFEIKKVNFR